MQNETLSLIAGFIAMAFVIVAYFVKEKKYYLLFQSLCIVGLIFSYFFNGQYFAMIALVTSLARALTFLQFEKKDKVAPIGYAFLFSALALAAYILVNIVVMKDAQPLDILCLSATVCYAFIFRIRNLKIVRYTMIVPTVLSIVFNILTSAAIFVTVSYTFELCADIVSIFKYHILPAEKTAKKSKE